MKNNSDALITEYLARILSIYISLRWLFCASYSKLGIIEGCNKKYAQFDIFVYIFPKSKNPRENRIYRRGFTNHQWFSQRSNGDGRSAPSGEFRIDLYHMAVTKNRSNSKKLRRENFPLQLFRKKFCCLKPAPETEGDFDAEKKRRKISYKSNFASGITGLSLRNRNLWNTCKELSTAVIQKISFAQKRSPFQHTTSIDFHSSFFK